MNMEREFKDRTFDTIVAKGTIDAMLCDGEEGKKSVVAVLAECYRVMKPDGKLIIISYSPPILPEDSISICRIDVFKTDHPGFKWTIEVEPMPKPKLADGSAANQFHYAYICSPEPVD